MADNERNIRAEAGKYASKLHSDVASPNHSHTLRKVVQLEEPVTGDCVLASCRVQHGRAMNGLPLHHKTQTQTDIHTHIHTHMHARMHAHSATYTTKGTHQAHPQWRGIHPAPTSHAVPALNTACQ